MKENEKIEAYGIKGMRNTRWRKTFKNQGAFELWVEKNDAEVQGTRRVEKKNGGGHE